MKNNKYLIIAMMCSLLLMISSIISMGSTTKATGLGDTAICTMEYNPVCAQPPMPDCPDNMGCIQVMPEPKTYSNKCMMDSDNAEYLYDGECSDDCTELANPPGVYCEDLGGKVNIITDETGEQYGECEFSNGDKCDEWKLYRGECEGYPGYEENIPGGDEDEYGCIGSAGYTWCEAKNKCLRTWEEKCEEPKVCTMEYAPVCGEVQVQCITAPCDPIKQTYSNKCMLENSNAKLLYEGECNNEKDTWTPPEGCIAYYDGCNNCGLMDNGMAACTEMYCMDYGEPKCTKYENKYQYQLTYTIKIKLKNIIDNFVEKIKAKGISDKNAIIVLDLAKEKIGDLEYDNPKLGLVINYIIELLESKKIEFYDSLDEIVE